MKIKKNRFTVEFQQFFLHVTYCCFQYYIEKTRKLALTDSFLTCVWEMTLSNVRWDLEYTDGRFRGFCLFLSANSHAVPELVQSVTIKLSF